MATRLVNAPAPPASITALELAFVVGPHTGQQVANFEHKKSMMHGVTEDRKLAAIKTDSERENERMERRFWIEEGREDPHPHQTKRFYGHVSTSLGSGEKF